MSDLNQSLCPLCKQINRCVIGLNKRDVCWCQKVSMPSDSLAIENSIQMIQEKSFVRSEPLTFDELKAIPACLCESCMAKINQLAIPLLDA